MVQRVQTWKNANKLTILSLLLILILLTMCSYLSFRYPILKMSAAQNGIILLAAIAFNSIINRDHLLRPYFLYVDGITILLLFRVGYYMFLTLSIGIYEHMSNMLAVFLSFFVYVWVTNKEIPTKLLVRWSETLVVVIGIQTIIAVFDGLQRGLPLHMLKSHIVTPIGASNTIATFLALLMPFIYKLEDSTFLKNISTFFIIALIILTRSNSGIITVFFLISILLLLEKKYRIFKALLFIAACFVIIYFISKYSEEYLLRMVNTFQMLFSKEQQNYNVALNGRVQIFSKVLWLFLENPWFGYGFSYRQYTNDLMSHNWILESLVTGGIISLLTQTAIYIIVFYKIFSNKLLDKACKEAIILSVIVALFQGMMEPSIGTINFDIIFWLLIGHGIYTCKHC